MNHFPSWVKVALGSAGRDQRAQGRESPSSNRTPLTENGSTSWSVMNSPLLAISANLGPSGLKTMSALGGSNLVEREWGHFGGNVLKCDDRSQRRDVTAVPSANGEELSQIPFYP
jgi:hypothetical protein